MKPWRVWKHTNHIWKKTMAAALAAMVMLSGAPCGMQRAEAGWDGWDDVIEVVSGTLIASFQRTQLLALGDNPAVQAELCSQAEKENDGRPDRRAVILTDGVMTRLVEQGNYALKNNSLPFRWRVVHKKEFNAYCDYSDFICVYDKLVKACHYNEDELAAVLAHEMAHGYNQHVARDAQKTILADVLADVALDQLDVASYGVGRQLPQALVDFAIVKNTTVASEKRADESGFYTMASAGFNPGGAAGSRTRGPTSRRRWRRLAAWRPRSIPWTSSGSSASATTSCSRSQATTGRASCTNRLSSTR